MEKTANTRPPLAVYVFISALLGLVAAALVIVTAQPAVHVAANRLVPPLFAMLALTGLVLLATAVVRNLAVALGKASLGYYRRYMGNTPDERIERPAQLFNNLVQVPVLFYVVCLLMMVQGQTDSVQVTLAWMFVILRVIHGLILLVWNHVPWRFTSYAAGVITLIVFAWRAAEQSWPVAIVG